VSWARARSDRDPDVRGAVRHGPEEHEIARLQVVALDLPPGEVLVARFTRQADAGLAVDVLDQAAAVEAGTGVAAAVPVLDPAQSQGRLNYRLGLLRRDRS
jgi:hypothetical protein